MENDGGFEMNMGYYGLNHDGDMNLIICKADMYWTRLCKQIGLDD